MEAQHRRVAYPEAALRGAGSPICVDAALGRALNTLGRFHQGNRAWKLTASDAAMASHRIRIETTSSGLCLITGRRQRDVRNR